MRMDDERRRIITKVAYMYYMEGLTQTEISNKMGIYRTTVSRMINKARQEGIVSISINGYDTSIFNLEEKLKEKYQLRYVVVVPNHPGQSNDDKDRQLSAHAGQYLKQIIEPGQVVGFSWGKIISGMVAGTREVAPTNATFVPLVGGPSSANTEYHVNTIVYDMARKFGGKNIFIDAAAVQKTPYIKQEVTSSRYFRDIETYWNNLDIACVGIGGPLNGNVSRWRDLLTKEDVDLLKDQHAIGDCCCTFFSREGKILRGNLLDRTIAVPLLNLQKVRHSIGVARSMNKAVSIDVLMKMNILHTLITDEETAQRLLTI